MVKIGNIISGLFPKTAEKSIENRVSSVLVKKVESDVAEFSREAADVKTTCVDKKGKLVSPIDAVPIFVSEFKQINKNVNRLFQELEKKYTTQRTVSHNGIEVGVQTTGFNPRINFPMYNGSEISIYRPFANSGEKIVCSVKPPNNLKSKTIKYFIDNQGKVERLVMTGSAKNRLLQDTEEAQSLIQMLKNISSEIDIY